MNWFHSVQGLGRPTILSVLGPTGRRAVGSGVLLPGRRFMTCAHVVNCALGKEMLAKERPESKTADVRVLVHVPGGPLERAAQLRVWIPPSSSASSLEWDGDLAVLDLDGDLPADVLPPRWQAMAERQPVRTWHGGGHAATFADAHVKSCDGRIGYFDGEPTGAAVEHGYSGGPLWWGEQEAVVGLVAAALVPPRDPVTGAPLPYSPENVIRRSWGVPWQRIRDQLVRAGWECIVDEVDGMSAVGPVDAANPADSAFAEILSRSLPNPAHRADVARTVAERCGHGYPGDGTAPSIDEFARLLTFDERALPALTEVLRPSTPQAATELLAVGRLSGVPRLLSPGERVELLAVLEGLPEAAVTRMPSVVRAALPLAELPGTLLTGSGWAGSAETRAVCVEALVDHLEGLQGDGRPVPEGTSRVPGLLRVAEYLAAVCPPDVGVRLRAWNSTVAARLDVHESALKERRGGAREWAELRNASAHTPWVLVRLVMVASGREGGERYRIRIWCDEGTGPRRVSDDDERPRSAVEAAKEILGVLEPLHRACPVGSCPIVELLVDRDVLELPADQWEWPGPAGLPWGVMGAEYPVVVNCPELLRQSGERFTAHWRERWRRLDDGGIVHVDESMGDARQVYGLLMDQQDAAQVTVGDLPPRLRVEIVQVCLAMGVPVVLWDRGAGTWSHVASTVAGVHARHLPEKVRTYRAKALHRPRQFSGRPVLAWADADRPAPSLQLADPMEDTK